MNDQDKVRQEVSRAYAQAVSQAASPSSCCCSGSAPSPKGVVVKMAGYDPLELAELPADAVVNSFGCGTPLAFSEVKEGDVVLDLGSGAGIDLLIAAKKVGPTGRVIGVDMTDEMIERARANIGSAGVTNVEVRKGIIEALPVEASSVDWVISNCVINLSPDKPKVFAEIARVLRPNGQIRISDIVAQDLPKVVQANSALYNSCVAGAIGEEAYLEGLRQAGLEDVRVLDRIVYDRSQLELFVGSELCTETTGSSCCGGGGSRAGIVDVDVIAEALVGKVWSARFAGRKP